MKKIAVFSRYFYIKVCNAIIQCLLATSARDRWSRRDAPVHCMQQASLDATREFALVHRRFHYIREKERERERDHFRNYRRIHCGGSPDTSRRALDALNLENFEINYGALYRIRLARLKFKLELASLVNNNWIVSGGNKLRRLANFWLSVILHHLSGILETFGS